MALHDTALHGRMLSSPFPPFYTMLTAFQLPWPSHTFRVLQARTCPYWLACSSPDSHMAYLFSFLFISKYLPLERWFLTTYLKHYSFIPSSLVYLTFSNNYYNQLTFTFVCLLVVSSHQNVCNTRSVSESCVHCCGQDVEWCLVPTRCSSPYVLKV